MDGGKDRNESSSFKLSAGRRLVFQTHVCLGDQFEVGVNIHVAKIHIGYLGMKVLQSRGTCK